MLKPLASSITLVSAGLLAWALNPSTAAAQNALFSRRTPVCQAVHKTKPAIVAVKVATPGGAKERVGSGVIIDERGYIVTNRHVLGASKSPRVQLHDGRILDAKVLFAEPRWDLAVLRVDAQRPLAALTLAPSDDLMVGESVIAVGHPYGYQNTVSVGIISALGREIAMPTGDVLTDLIQTDASINPGNSGGPLLNVNGELVGITCALREDAQGIAFAISSATVKHALRTLLSAERVAGVRHGIACLERTMSETGDRQRVLVANSRHAALRAGDEIVAIADRPITGAFDLERALWDARPGDTVAVQVRRAGRIVAVVLALPGIGEETLAHADSADSAAGHD